MSYCCHFFQSNEKRRSDTLLTTVRGKLIDIQRRLELSKIGWRSGMVPNRHVCGIFTRLQSSTIGVFANFGNFQLLSLLYEIHEQLFNLAES